MLVRRIKNDPISADTKDSELFLSANDQAAFVAAQEGNFTKKGSELAPEQKNISKWL